MTCVCPVCCSETVSNILIPKNSGYGDVSVSVLSLDPNQINLKINTNTPIKSDKPITVVYFSIAIRDLISSKAIFCLPDVVLSKSSNITLLDLIHNINTDLIIYPKDYSINVVIYDQDYNIIFSGLYDNLMSWKNITGLKNIKVISTELKYPSALIIVKGLTDNIITNGNYEVNLSDTIKSKSVKVESNLICIQNLPIIGNFELKINVPIDFDMNITNGSLMIRDQKNNVLVSANY